MISKRVTGQIKTITLSLCFVNNWSSSLHVCCCSIDLLRLCLLLNSITYIHWKWPLKIWLDEINSIVMKWTHRDIRYFNGYFVFYFLYINIHKEHVHIGIYIIFQNKHKHWYFKLISYRLLVGEQYKSSVQFTSNFYFDSLKFSIHAIKSHLDAFFVCVAWRSKACVYLKYPVKTETNKTNKATKTYITQIQAEEIQTLWIDTIEFSSEKSMK